MHHKRSLLAALPAALLIPLSVGAAHAAPPQTTPSGTFSVNLQAAPDDPAADGGSNVTGHATLVLHGRNLTVDLETSGLTPNEPHAMHIHGMLGMNNTCPTLKADTNTGDPIDPASLVAGVPDGIISLSEGHTTYGPIQVSLTGTGDTSAASGLNLSQFMKADSNGNLDYHRSFMVPIDVAKDLTDLHVVVHGLDLPTDADSSSLTSLFEATTPVSCGQITRD